MCETENKETATLEVEVKIKAFDKKSSRMVEVFDAKAKAIKTNKPENTVIIKDNMEIKIDGFRTEEGFAFPNVLAKCGSKLTKADAGKA
jgi:hypothetical protein